MCRFRVFVPLCLYGLIKPCKRTNQLSKLLIDVFSMLTEVHAICLLKRNQSQSPPVVAATEAAAPAPARRSRRTGDRKFCRIRPTLRQKPDEEITEEDLADARDPASFVSFVMSIASNAASASGMMEHPVTHQREVDVELGKHWIDVLGMLQKKTAG